MNTRSLAAGVFLISAISVILAGGGSPAHAFDVGDLAKEAAGAAGNSARDKAVAEVNAKLLAEGRKNQCSFKTDSDQFQGNCDKKLKNLVNTIVEVKKRLQIAHVTDFKFEVSGHTDSRGNADHNKELSSKRAAVIAKELGSRGVPANEIISVGMGAEHPRVTPDNTPAKQAMNRRYEIQLKF